MITVVVSSKRAGITATGRYTARDLLETDEDSLVYELTACNCQPVGETNVIECNCDELWEDYALYIYEDDEISYKGDLQAAEQLINDSICVIENGQIRKVRSEDIKDKITAVHVDNFHKATGKNGFIEKGEYVRYRIIN